MTYAKDINVGDIIYTVEEIHNWINGRQHRLTMIDDEGNEWYRYDKPSIEYHVENWLVKGKVTQQFDGELPENENIGDYTDTIFVENVKTQEQNTLIERCGTPFENVFVDIGDAEAAKDELKKGR